MSEEGKLRTAREINVPKKEIENENLDVRVGTAENRNNPETIYIEISFWIESKDKNKKSEELRREIKNELKNVYKNYLSDYLKNNSFFPFYDENLFIVNVPENINYNNKRNFISVELYLHTINIKNNKVKYPLNKKKNKELYNQAVFLAYQLSKSDILKGKKGFQIYSKK